MASTAPPAASSSAITTSAEHVVLKKKMPAEKFRKSYTPPLFHITHVELDFSLGYKSTQVRSTLTIHRSKDSPPGTDLVLDGEELKLLEAQLNDKALQVASALIPSGERLCYVDGDERLTVSGSLLPTKPEESFKLTTLVEIHPDTNLGLMGLFKSGAILVTQCEAEGFRRITYFLDRPDVMSIYKVRLAGNKKEFPVLISNGNRTEEGDVPGGTSSHYAVFDDPFPKPCYLFAVIAGQLQSLSDVYQHPLKPNGKKVNLHIWSEPSQIPKLGWSMESIKRAMQWDEDTFGLEYDLDVFNIVCVRDFNMGAMENKSLNVFVSSLLLATPETSTDTDYQRILGVVGHEYFHNWTGDRVTCRDWFQLTLKEGLTVFRDQQFSADMGSAAVQRIEDVIQLRARQFAEDNGPMAHPIRPESYIAMDNFYTSTVYEKGAEVIRMYHTILGPHGFRKGMDLYFKRHDGHAVTCDDFRSAMADANQFDFTQFERWYLQAGTPVVTVLSTHYDPSAKQFKFRVKQQTPATPKQPRKDPLHIPLVVGLLGKQSKSEISASTVYHFKQEEQEFVVEGVEQDVFLSILRGYSAPVKLVFEQSDDDLAFQMAYDTDAFNRWDAGQKLMSRVLMNRSKKIRDGEMDPTSPPALPTVIIDTFRQLLNQKGVDDSFKALALLLPTENVIANDMRPCDPVAIHEARESLRKQVRTALLPDMQNIYTELSRSLESKAYAILPASENTAPRHLRNLLLSYITCESTEETVALAASHFAASRNMTDKLAALRCLVNSKSPQRDAALGKFYTDANDDDLVIDKWFAIQAGADTAGLLDEVQKLMSHPKFTLKTPSRMRCVVSRYAMNSAHFHRKDGRGYKFVADAVLAIDDFNGPIAAKLANYLIDWKIYDESRQKLMKAELQRMMDTNKLKPETYEIVKRGLQN